jgi:hypothetical protein
MDPLPDSDSDSDSIYGSANDLSDQYSTATASLSSESLSADLEDDRLADNSFRTKRKVESLDVDSDILPRIKGMYRLLQLYSEQGSGGLGMSFPKIWH